MLLSFNCVHTDQETKPFVVQPDYNKWSPWIGPQTRKSNLVYNTEWEKVHKKLTSSEKVNVEIPEDRLLEQVMAMKVNFTILFTFIPPKSIYS